MTSDEFRAKLRALSLRQVRFAELSGYNREYINRMATGKRPVSPRVEWMLELIEGRGDDPAD
jgi:hypothetical protein